MKLIEEKEVQEIMASNELCNGRNWKEKQIAFKSGVSFAEVKLSQLAIEFAEWCERDCSSTMRLPNTLLWRNWRKTINSEYTLTTSQLFEIFLNERKEK